MSEDISKPEVSRMEITVGAMAVRYGIADAAHHIAAGDAEVWLYLEEAPELCLGDIHQAEQIAAAIGRVVSAVRGDE